MAKIIRMASRKAGLPPGTLVHLGEQRVANSSITVIDYDEHSLQEWDITDVAACRELLNPSTVSWLNFTGLHDVERLRRIGEVFQIHPLVLEDIAHTEQRPKIEDLTDYVFVVVRMLYRRAQDQQVVSEQVSLIVGRGYVLTFQEIEGDVFGIIRDRIRAARGRVRSMGPDYLAYALIDAIVDNYFVVLEDIGSAIDDLQEKVFRHSDSSTLRELHRLRSEMIFIRKALWPMREVVSALEKNDGGLIAAETHPYLRDVYEHTVQVIDTIEMLRDMLTAALEIYMSSAGNRMNQIMQVLTVIATIFIPLTFIAGVYGMNFEIMPELKWRYGYAGVWAVMLAVAIAMLSFFRRRKWL
jgi:magnesium transporter